MRLIRVTGLLLALAVLANAQGPKLPDKFTNLKVLPTSISKDELVTTMRLFARSLGVRCGHCHEINKAAFEKSDFASDNKPEKDVARTMLMMTTNINKEFISQVDLPEDPKPKPVNCWTCHRGQVKPETGPPPEPERKTDDTPPSSPESR